MFTLAYVKLPSRNCARIEPAKLTEYLLNPDHPEGAGKAAFFTRMGYTRANPSALERDLLQIARTGVATETIVTHYGTKYVVDGGAMSPNGRVFVIRTVWLMQPETIGPHLVTAYPRSP